MLTGSDTNDNDKESRPVVRNLCVFAIPFLEQHSMFECGHIVLRMMLSPARGVVLPSLYRNPCKVEIPYQGKLFTKVNPWYHKHVYLIVSRHTLKHTYNAKVSKQQKPSGKPKKPKQPKRSRQKLSKTIGETKGTFRPMSTLADMGLKIFFVFWFSLWFWWFLFWPLWLFWFLWFSRWFLKFPNIHLILRKGSYVDAFLCWIKHSLYTGFHISEASLYT